MKMVVRRGFHTVTIYGSPTKPGREIGCIAIWYDANRKRRRKRFRTKTDAIAFAKDILLDVPGYDWGVKALAYSDRSTVRGPDRPTSVYLIRHRDLVKIGIAEDVGKRMVAHRTSNPGELTLLKELRFPYREMAESVEKDLHRHFRGQRIRGEWFQLTDEEVKNIPDSQFPTL